jgi:hypothetical protein
LFIFCGPKNPNIKLGNAAIDEFIKIEVIRLKTNGANNLDFHLAYYLGKFSQTAPKEIQFHIITKDTGFNGIVSHIKKSGRSCQRVGPPEKKKERKLSPCADLIVTRLQKIDGRKRPRKEQQLVNWIESQCQPVSKNINGKSVLGELVKSGLINKDKQLMRYTFNS